MKRIKLIISFLGMCLLFCLARYAFAEDAEVKLNSNDGTTGFIIQDKDAVTIFSTDSDGNTVIGGTVAIAGSGFSVGGSTLVVKGGNVGIGTAMPAAMLDVNGGVRVGNFITAARPAAVPANKGTFIFDTDLGKPYVSNGTVWKPLDSDFDSDGITDAIDVDDNNAADATAVAADALAGKTFYAGGGSKIGTMPIQTFSPANDTVNAGYYAATTLSAVDTDLAAGNIKSGINIFGKAGTLLTSPPPPDVGGTWLLVPGEVSLGTRDFYVQKYEARDVGGVPTSQPAGTPWVLITQTLAKTKCTALGAGYHLVTMEEAQTISRNIEANGWNWTGGSVGSGGLWRGHTDSVPINALAADITGDPDDDPYVGTGDTAPSIEKRVHQLSTGQYIWDWSGNVLEWLEMTCSGGTGTGLWDVTAAWQEWNIAALSDYEKVRAGPAGAYTSAQNAGRYYGCAADGNVVTRGGGWTSGVNSGVFAFQAAVIPLDFYDNLGFRCSR